MVKFGIRRKRSRTKGRTKIQYGCVVKLLRAVMVLAALWIFASDGIKLYEYYHDGDSSDYTHSLQVVNTPMNEKMPPVLSQTQSSHIVSSCPNGSTTNGFLSQTIAQKVAAELVLSQKEKGGKPRFVPVLNDLMKAAAENNQTVLTMQLGAMDGKTGDPMHRMTDWHKKLTHWMPIALEPVPSNFKNLVTTYQNHQKKLGLPCFHLFNQVINYDKKNEVEEGQCNFCHFDFDKEECKNEPEWMKYEVGNMECGKEDFKKCFKKDSFPCGSVKSVLDALKLSSENLAVLQIDVEGYEGSVFDGFFAEIPKEHLPPVINFENKTLRGRKKLQKVYEKLRDLGYGLHEKRVDTLALLRTEGNV